MTARPRNAVVHGACGSWWTGSSRMHCPAAGCHRTFSSDSAADRHRKTVDGTRTCVDPATVGLVPAEHPWGVCWSLPAPTNGYHPRTTTTEPATAAAAQWNEHHPIGTPVYAWPGLRTDEPLTTRTRTPAWTLGHGEPVVSVDGYAGGIALDHVEPRQPAQTITPA